MGGQSNKLGKVVIKHKVTEQIKTGDEPVKVDHAGDVRKIEVTQDDTCKWPWAIDHNSAEELDKVSVLGVTSGWWHVDNTDGDSMMSVR